MKYLIVLLSLVFLLGMLAYAQESTTGEPGIGLPADIKPVDGVLSPNASVPNKISYQGLLTTTGGAPVADGSYELKFELFNVSGGGGALWSETQAGVNVYKGTFSVLLGSVTPLTPIFDQPLWIEVTANSGPGIAAPVLFTPRTEMASAAYSLGPLLKSGDNYYLDSAMLGVGMPPQYPYGVDALSAGNNFIRARSTGGWVGFVADKPAANSNNYFVLKSGGVDKWVLGTAGSNNFAIGPWSSGIIPYFYMDTLGKIGIGHSAPQKLLDVDGPVHVGDTLFVGSSTETGIVNVYQNGAAQPTIYLGPYMTYGGEVRIRDEEGNSFFYAEPDADGIGGFFRINRTASSSGFIVDGNYMASQQPYVSINGSPRSVVFNMNSTANSSVVLPDSSISALEMFNEPGIANSQRTSFITIPTVATALLADSVDITVPASGYVEITGGAWLNVNHTTGTTTEVQFGISTSRATVDIYPGLGVVRIPSACPTGTGSSAYGYPCMTSRFYSVSAGTQRFYVNFYWQSGSASSVNAGYPYIRAKYYPTLYGTSTVIDPMAVNVVSGPTDGSEEIYIPQMTITPEEHLSQLKAKAAQLRSEIEETIKKIEQSADEPQGSGN